jgi:phage tail sheath protein FI
MWVNFENNTADLQLQVFTQMYSLFLGWHNEKYFAGKTPAESFFIVCDGSNNTEDSEGDGELIIDYGIAPSKPAEFIRHRLRQKTLK